MQVREILDTVVEGAAGGEFAEAGDPFCKLERGERARNDGRRGDLGNSHDGGASGTFSRPLVSRTGCRVLYPHVPLDDG